MLGDHLLDLILLLLLVLFAVSGYRQGFIVGVLSFIGFVGGGVIGMLIAPPLARAVVDGPAQQALLAIVIAFLSATLGQLLASSAGSVLRNRVTGENARTVDAAAGAVVSGLSLLVVAWFLGTALAGARFAPLQHQVKNSEVLKAVNGAMPDAAQSWFNTFKVFVADKQGWPQVFGGLGGEPIVDVKPPDYSLLTTPALKAVRGSIVKIVGTAPSCQKQIEGTGFVYAPERVMTNAHVVAGVRNSPTVSVGDHRYHGKVVLYDPRRDIAVLVVPGLRATPLRFDTEAKSGDSSLVVGYPKNQNFTARPARVRAKQIAKGPDIYHSPEPVKREIYSIRGVVEPGNSGGPLVSSSGTVYGVIFAAALDSKDETGYALTASEVSADAQTGLTTGTPVSTGGCTD